MILRAKPPAIKKSTRAKILISGLPGTGKTTWALNLPNNYFMDAEEGAQRKQYQELLIKSNGVYFGREDGASDFSEIIKECKSLATEKHNYKTMTIDSLSYVYNQESAEAELRVGSAFGADKKEANKPCRQLIRWINKMDMNVVLIAHSKSDWSNRDKDGQPSTTFDAYEKIAYELDLWLEFIDKKIIVRKTRIESFKEGMTISRDYKEFADLFGVQDINREHEAIKLATSKQIEKAVKLTQGLNMSQDDINKIWKKVDVESWDEMKEDQIISCIDFMQDKINKLKGE